MLFRRHLWDGLATGNVTVAFRRWRRPSVRAEGTLQSPGGLLAIDEVTAIEPTDVTDVDARAAGYRDRDEALADVASDDGDRALYRIRFHRLGDDPRVELRERTSMDEGEIAELRRALGRLDWAVPTLRLIGEAPGVVSTDLAARIGVDRMPFKQRVRRLKGLGLTESLVVGYRLSPRGEAVLRLLDDGTA